MKEKGIPKPMGFAITTDAKDIFEALELASQHGLTAIEINLNIPCFFPEKYSQGDRKKIKKYADEKEIHITFHAPEDISLYQLHSHIRKAAMERLKECIDFIYETGGSKITIHPGETVVFTMTDRKMTLIEAYPEEFSRIFKESLIEIRDYCRGKILPCIENNSSFNTIVADVLAELLPMGDLYLTWDIGHSYGNLLQESFYRSHKSYIKNCHVHDNNGKSDHQVIGTGDVDFLDFFREMADVNTSYIIEVRPIEMALLSLKRLKRILKVI
ncbi:sugar phosphate isomerase/epimerase family protein [Alkaliphilus peptidifermentans]|uniref:Sugar phosphate isomerase/epimerase n=1 Tax=Alkaliphilus peptidifermentans DSM 18978 TaxID=1120976 RepID=A0A1G5GII1_9FIRM|nr:sugar phosphate isomerase/epimerase [Alkaliphilus peptidifermentans]SCY51304.1 Sugar phosphate isomerase/epimerase [Alkaliphilus peptidifermentans DSM 18978]